MHLIGFLIIGLVAGWLAGVLLKGRGFGFWGNLGVGVGGALLGALVLKIIGIVLPLVGSLLLALGGAVLLLGLVGLIKRK